MFGVTVSPVEQEMLAKVLLAAFLGLLIGIERRGGVKGAGMRTFSLICMGSALFTVLSLVGFPGEMETTRVAAQIVSGIGFIGAGVIWRQREEAVHGITTAAAIWVTAAIGISVGVGFYVLACVLTIVTMVILAKGHPLRSAKETVQTEFQT